MKKELEKYITVFGPFKEGSKNKIITETRKFRCNLCDSVLSMKATDHVVKHFQSKISFYKIGEIHVVRVLTVSFSPCF
jgi:hypothetical protein